MEKVIKFPFMVMQRLMYDSFGADKESAEGFNSTFEKAVSKVIRKKHDYVIIDRNRNNTVCALIVKGKLYILWEEGQDEKMTMKA